MKELQETLARPVGPRCTVHLLSASAARFTIINDRLLPFFSRISSLDRAVRLQRPLHGIPESDQKRLFVQHLQAQVRNWTEEEARALLQHCREAEKFMRRIAPDFPPQEWRFLKTSGQEEAESPYVRGDVVVLPQRKLRNLEDPDFVRMLIHESFHAWSRLHPERRDRLYARLGFQHLKTLELGPWYKQHQITNPDGSHLHYGIDVSHQGRPFKAATLLYSEHTDYVGGQLFDYVRLGLFELEQREGFWALRKPEAPRAYSPDELSGFYEQITHNTGYILHPDEILASNIELLALWETIPEEIEKLTPAGLKLLSELKTELGQKPIGN